jgi:SSS family solute:Na+ symporter
MTITFILIVIIMVVISISRPARDQSSHVIVIDPKQFAVSPAFIVGSVFIMGILAALYTVFW